MGLTMRKGIEKLFQSASGGSAAKGLLPANILCQAEKAGVDAEIKVFAVFSALMGVGAVLVIEAERMGCALIVVGTRGKTGIKRTLLGSVASYVVQNAHCDVYDVRSG